MSLNVQRTYRIGS